MNKEFIKEIYNGISEANLEKAIDNWDVAIGKILQPREIYILNERYENENKKTLEEIGKELGVSRERVRQIEFKAIRKLKSPRAINIIFLNDIQNEIDKKILEKEKLLLDISEEVDDLKELFETLLNLGGYQIKLQKKETKVLDQPVEVLDLSIRAYNCLRRSRIDTIRELTNKTELDLMRVRNMGRKSLLEIKTKLEDLGLSLKESEYDIDYTNENERDDGYNDYDLGEDECNF